MRTLITLIVLVELLLLAVFTRPESAALPAPVTSPVPPVVLFDMHCDKSPPAYFDVLVRSAAFEFGIDPRVLATTVYRESDCDAKALGSSGEIGLGQIHPTVWGSTLVEAGIIRRTKDLWLPITNLRASAYILARLSAAAKGDLRGTFRRYNGSGPKARKYAREQVQTFASLWLQGV